MTKKKKPPFHMSPAMQLMMHVWDHAMKTMSHSWERRHHTMYASVTLAITGGFKFDVDDFSAIGKHCRPGRWLHVEQAYLMAVSTPNMPACVALEKYLKREPIIADNVSGPGWNHYSSFSSVRGRLARDCTFDYQGLRPKVTSFSDGHVVACTHKKKVDRRFKLTRKDIIIDRADQKERLWILHRGVTAWGYRASNKFMRLFPRNLHERAFLQLPRKQIDVALDKLGLKIGKADEADGGSE